MAFVKPATGLPTWWDAAQPADSWWARTAPQGRIEAFEPLTECIVPEAGVEQRRESCLARGSSGTVGAMGRFAGVETDPSQQLRVELGLQRCNRDVPSIAGLVDVVEVGAAVEDVLATRAVDDPGRPQGISRDHERSGAIDHRDIDGLSLSGHPSLVQRRDHPEREVEYAVPEVADEIERRSRYRPPPGTAWNPMARPDARPRGRAMRPARAAPPRSGTGRSAASSPAPTPRPSGRTHTPRARSQACASSPGRDDHRASRRTASHSNARPGASSTPPFVRLRTRSSSSSPVVHSMIQPPTRTRASVCDTTASNGDSPCAVTAPNLSDT